MILQDALTLLPSFAVAVIVVTPFFNAFTFPCLSTVATFLLEDVHLTSLISASDGETTAFNVSVAPFFIPAFVLFNVIFLTFTSFFSVSGFFSVSFSGAFFISPSFTVPNTSGLDHPIPVSSFQLNVPILLPLASASLI